MADKEKQIRKKEYGVYHVPISENTKFNQKEYYDTLKELFANDPTAEARLMRGLWVDAPSGEAMYRDNFVESVNGQGLHVRGNAYTGVGLLPAPGLPILIGYDPGPANFCVAFLQLRPVTGGKYVWVVFDELNFVGRRFTYRSIVRCVVERMNFWRDHHTAHSKYTFEHIADMAAFNQQRSDGSFEVQELQKHFLEFGENVVMKACPKGDESVSARGWRVSQLLDADEILFSATCIETVKAMRMIEPDIPKNKNKYNPMARFQRKHGIYSHPFDAFTYVIHYFDSMGQMSRILPVRSGQVDGPRIYQARGR